MYEGKKLAQPEDLWSYPFPMGHCKRGSPLFLVKNWKGAVVSFSEADRQKGENVGIKCPLVSRSAFGKCLSFVWVTYLVSLKQFFTLKMRILIIYIFLDVWEG
jgi:hypothetical protein